MINSDEHIEPPVGMVDLGGGWVEDDAMPVEEDPSMAREFRRSPIFYATTESAMLRISASGDS